MTSRWLATAVGVIPAGDGYGDGQMQVVQWASGGYAIVHPALACPAGINPYDGLGAENQHRWLAFDRAEADARHGRDPARGPHHPR